MFSIQQSATLVQYVFANWQREGFAYARTIVSRLKADANDAQALAILSHTMLQTWPGAETFELCERLLTDSLSEGDASLEILSALMSLIVERLDTAPETLVRAVISAMGRKSDQRVSALGNLVRFEAVDGFYSDHPIRTAAKRLIRDKPVALSELQAMEAVAYDDDLRELPLYQKLCAMMVMGLALAEGEDADDTFRVLLPLLNAPNEKLSEAVWEKVLRLLERSSVKNLQPFLQAVESRRGNDMDVMLSAALVRLDSSSGLRIAVPQLIQICNWPELAQAWPRTRSVIPEVAGRLFKHNSLHDGIALIESCVAPELRRALVETLVEKSAAMAGVASQGVTSGPFVIYYGAFPSETKVLESLLQDCRAVHTGLAVSDDADRIICNLYECMGYAHIEDLPMFLNALLALPAPLPEVIGPSRNAAKEERFAFYDAISGSQENSVSLQRGQAADMLIQMAIERNPEGFSRFTNICDSLARWLLAFPVNSLKPDDACVEILLRAIQNQVNKRGTTLLGEENWPLFALLEKGGDGTREIALYLCGDLICGKLTQSYQSFLKTREIASTNGRGLFRRVAQLTSGVRDSADRLKLIVNCVCDMEASNRNFCWYFFKDYLNSDNVVKLVRGELKDETAFNTAAASLMRRLLAFVGNLDNIDAETAARMSNAIGSTCRKCLMGTRNSGYLSAEWMSRILWMGQRVLESYHLEPALLTRWIKLVFSEKETTRTELKFAFSKSVFEPTLSIVLKKANDSTPEALLYYLQWRLALCRSYTISQAMSGEKVRIAEVCRFLVIPNCRHILKGWFCLLEALTPRLEQDIYHTIGMLCNEYVRFVNGSFTLGGFALLFPDELNEPSIERFGKYQVETAAVIAATVLYELGPEAFEGSIKRLSNDLTPKSRLEFNNFQNPRLRTIKHYYVRKPMR